MAEGKSPLPSHVTTASKCEGCETCEAAYFCHDCPMALCNTCVVPHRKVKMTANHQLTKVTGLEKSIPRSGNAVLFDIPCAEHQKSFVNSICRTCEEVLCNTCKPAHKGHTLIDPKSDLALLQKIAVSTIAKLSENVLHLDKAKMSATELISFYKDAKKKIESWRRVIVDCANKGADSLQSQIDQHITKIELMVDVKTGTLVKESEQNDQHANKINSIRRTTDSSALLAGIAEGNLILKSGKAAMASPCIKPTPKMENMFPHMNMFNQIQCDINKFFTILLDIWDPVSTTQGHACEYKKQKEFKGIALGSNYLHRICEEYNAENVLTFYADGTGEIVKLDLTSFSTTEHNIDVKIGTMIAPSGNRYVILTRGRGKEIILHDKQLRIRKRMAAEHVITICLYGDNAYLECSHATKTLTSLRFSKVSVKNDKFITTILAKVNIETPSFMSLHHNKHDVTMYADSTLYKVNLTNSAVSSHDISKHISRKVEALFVWGEVHALFVDDYDNILVGDAEGRVHLYSPMVEHSILHTVPDGVNGITVHKDVLVASYSGCAKVKLFR